MPMTNKFKNSVRLNLNRIPQKIEVGCKLHIKSKYDEIFTQPFPVVYSSCAKY